MAFNDTTNDTRLQFGINATWGGSKPTKINANVGVQTGNVGLKIGYDFTPKKESQRPLPTMLFDELGKNYFHAEEGKEAYQFAIESSAKGGCFW